MRHRPSNPRSHVFPPGCKAFVAALVLSWSPLSANETDQFLLPTDKPFADIGPLISAAHYSVLETVVGRLNDRIRQAQDIESPARRQARLGALHSPRRIANMVRSEFGPGFFETLGVERSLRGSLARRAYPGDAYTAYKRSDWLYAFAHVPVDPRNLPLLVPSSTVLVYGHYTGTDKFGHFHDLGHYYYIDYLNKTGAGKSEEEAVEEILHTYSRGVISESQFIGRFSTGVASNADLVANFMGMKFYRNLTEPVALRGEESPPLLVLVGGFWRLNTHVRPDADFLEPYFSDHWNEALNPNAYGPILRAGIERKLHKRADEVIGFYCTVDGRPDDPAYFKDLADELSTYYGESYGHLGAIDGVLGVADCFASTDPD